MGKREPTQENYIKKLTPTEKTDRERERERERRDEEKARVWQQLKQPVKCSDWCVWSVSWMYLCMCEREREKKNDYLVPYFFLSLIFA